jgi:enoyl-CoA hydratase
LILHARLINPKEAHDLGIINKLLPKDNFLEELRFYCKDLANRAPIALNQVKKIIHQGLDMSLEESLMLEQKAFDVTMNSQDAARAMRSLLNTEENIEDASKFEWKGE